jgi:Leucine-rich repeat (LRR) protein
LRRYIGGLTALKTLILDGNRLTSVPAALGGLTALTALHLGRAMQVDPVNETQVESACN